MAADALRRYANEYKPQYVPSMSQSLVRILVDQAVDYRTIGAFQTMLTRQPLSDMQMQALEAIAERQGVSGKVIDVLTWLWTGGRTTSEEMSRELIAEKVEWHAHAADGHDLNDEETNELLKQLEAKPITGSLMLEVIRGR